MIRAFFDEFLVFLIPFAAFAITLVVLRRNVLHLPHWLGAAAWLVGAGLLLVFGSLLYEGLFAARPQSGFEPTHMENGRLVPGRFR